MSCKRISIASFVSDFIKSFWQRYSNLKMEPRSGQSSFFILIHPLYTHTPSQKIAPLAIPSTSLPRHKQNQPLTIPSTTSPRCKHPHRRPIIRMTSENLQLSISPRPFPCRRLSINIHPHHPLSEPLRLFHNPHPITRQ